MHSYKDIEEKLLKYIEENDPQKDTKISQIKHWYKSYFRLFRERFSFELDFISQVLFDSACWRDKIIGEDKKIKLDKKSVIEKIAIKRDGNPLNFAARYTFACWSCDEDSIKKVFDESTKNLLDREDFSIEEFLKRRFTSNQVMNFWSYYINRDALSDIYKNKYTYEYGFECAIRDKNINALEFFWNQIKQDVSLSQEKKDEIIMRPALYIGINTGANADMVKFSLSHINPNKYRDLLKKDFSEKGYYSILGTLKNEYCFEDAKKLFGSLEPEDLSYRKYESSISFILNRIDDAPDIDSINSGGRLLDFIWNRPGFEAHREYFLEQASDEFSPTGQSLIDLFMKGQSIEIVSKILNEFNTEQKKSIEGFDPKNVEVLKQVMASTAEKHTALTLGTETVNASGSLLLRKVTEDYVQYTDNPS